MLSTNEKQTKATENISLYTKHLSIFNCKNLG